MRWLTKSAYWYVCRRLYPEEDRVAWRAGLRVWYWNAAGKWATTTPRQFATPEEAMRAFEKATMDFQKEYHDKLAEAKHTRSRVV